MWIFTKHGFFSCTMSTHEPGRFNIRARAKHHLEALIDAHRRQLGRCKIIETPAADYRWRIMMTPQTWARVAMELAEQVDYTNFKNACHSKGAGAGDIGSELMQTWSIMNRYQLRKHHPRGEDGFGWLPLGAYRDDEPIDEYVDELELEPEDPPHDYSALEHDLQQAGSRGLFVRPSLEGLPDDWRAELENWIDEPLTIEQVGDDAFAVKITAADPPAEEPELIDDPVDLNEPSEHDEDPPAKKPAAPLPTRARALTAEQQKIDALLEEERAKTPDGQLHDRGPGDKPHRPDFGDQKDPKLGIVTKDGKLTEAQRAMLPGAGPAKAPTHCSFCGTALQAGECPACGDD